MLVKLVPILLADVVPDHLNDVVDHLVFTFGHDSRYHDFVEGEIFVKPDTDLGVVVEGDHFVGDEEGFFGVEHKLGEPIEGGFEDGECFEVGEVVDGDESLEHFFGSDSEELVFFGDELVGEDDDDVFGVAGGPEFIDFDIIGYADIVIFDNVFFELGAGFGGLDEGGGAGDAFEAFDDLDVLVDGVGFGGLLCISHLNYNQFIITL